MAIPVEELQSLTNKSIIELFSLTLVPALHGSSDVTRFHSGVGMNSNASIIWQGNTYDRFPVTAEGFEYNGRGQLPRPTFTVSNVLGTITALMADVNSTTPFNDLQGAKIIRHRTMAQFLDAANFAPATATITTTFIADPSDVETVTFTVTVVQDSEGNNVFAIDGTQRPVLTMKRNSTYIFNQSHSSNVGHPLRIKSDAGGQQSTTNSGTLGTDATVTYQPVYPSAPSDLRYYCSVHGNAMGNTITMNDPNLVDSNVQASTVAQSSTNANPFGTPSSTTEFPQEIYFIDRKTIENREIVQFECVSALDLENIRAPKRQVTRKDFPSVGTFR